MSTTVSRRSVLKTSLLALPALGRSGAALPKRHATPEKDPALTHPKVSLNVSDFGAKADGATLASPAIQRAIDRCWVFGGGEVLVPAGSYLIGAIALRSGVLLRLAEGAVLNGSPDFSLYPVTEVRWEGKWIPGHLGLIYALDAHDIGVVGPGRIVGNPALGGRPNAQNPLRHPALIEPIRCSGLRFEDFSTSYYRMWSLHPTCCQDILCRNLTIRSTGGNGDGIDLDSCRNARIEHCDIATGDDCISLKSGRGSEAFLLAEPTEDVRISDCTFADSIFACIGIGSETSGGIRNVTIERCKFTAAKTFAIYIKTHVGRGAFIENITCNDLQVSGTEGGLLRLNITGSGLQDQDPVPGLEGVPSARNLRFTNITVKDAPVLVDGTSLPPEKPLDGFTFANISGSAAKGIYLANVRNADIRKVAVTGVSGAMLNTHNVTGKGLAGAVSAPEAKAYQPVPPPAEPYKLH